MSAISYVDRHLILQVGISQPSANGFRSFRKRALLFLLFWICFLELFGNTKLSTVAGKIQIILCKWWEIAEGYAGLSAWSVKRFVCRYGKQLGKLRVLLFTDGEVECKCREVVLHGPLVQVQLEEGVLYSSYLRMDVNALEEVWRIIT